MSKTNVLPYFPKLTYQYSIHTWHWKIILSLLLTEILQELLKSDFWYPCANVEANHYHCPEATLITCLRISDSSNTKCHITKVKNFEVIHYNPGNRQAPGDPLGFHSSTQSQRLSSTSKPSTKKKKKPTPHAFWKIPAMVKFIFVWDPEWLTSECCWLSQPTPGRKLEASSLQCAHHLHSRVRAIAFCFWLLLKFSLYH